MNVQELIERLSKLDPKLPVIAGNPNDQEGGFWVKRVYLGGWIGDGEYMGAAGDSNPAATIELLPFHEQ